MGQDSVWRQSGLEEVSLCELLFRDEARVTLVNTIPESADLNVAYDSLFEKDKFFAGVTYLIAAKQFKIARKKEEERRWDEKDKSLSQKKQNANTALLRNKEKIKSLDTELYGYGIDEDTTIRTKKEDIRKKRRTAEKNMHEAEEALRDVEIDRPKNHEQARTVHANIEQQANELYSYAHSLLPEMMGPFVYFTDLDLEQVVLSEEKPVIPGDILMQIHDTYLFSTAIHYKATKEETKQQIVKPPLDKPKKRSWFRKKLIQASLLLAATAIGVGLYVNNTSHSPEKSRIEKENKKTEYVPRVKKKRLETVGGFKLESLRNVNWAPEPMLHILLRDKHNILSEFNVHGYGSDSSTIGQTDDNKIMYLWFRKLGGDEYKYTSVGLSSRDTFDNIPDAGIVGCTEQGKEILGYFFDIHPKTYDIRRVQPTEKVRLEQNPTTKEITVIPINRE